MCLYLNMKIPTNIQFWVDKLKNNEKFSMARWGDGELYCMWGRQGQNSNGCRYSPELRQALLDAMEPRDGFYHGLQRVLPRDEERIRKEYPDVRWYETECFSEAVAEGKLYPLIEQLRKMRTVIVSNEKVSNTAKDILGDNCRGAILVPSANAYDYKSTVIDWFNNHYVPADDTVWLFSCGMAANAFISELHGKKDAWLIDVGHIWDPFTGLMSRCDLEGKTMDDINKNLHEANN